MTTQRNDDLPLEIEIYRMPFDGDYLLAFGEPPQGGIGATYVRKDLSTPVPDDVADDIKRTRELWEKTNNKIPDYMERIIRAASTSKVKVLETLCDKYSDTLLDMNLRNDQLIEALEDAHEALAATLAKSDNAVLYQRISNILAAIRSEETIPAASTQSAEVRALREALEMITGKRQCLDNLMSNVDIAEAALQSTRTPPVPVETKVAFKALEVNYKRAEENQDETVWLLPIHAERILDYLASLDAVLEGSR